MDGDQFNRRKAWFRFNTILIEKNTMKRRQNLCLIVSICVLSSSALAGLFDPPAPLIQNADRSLTNQEIFNAFHSFMPETGLPSRQPTLPPLLPGAAIFPLEFRSIDGTNNNLINPTLGSANTPFLRTTTNAYGDGLDTPAGADQKGTREQVNVNTHWMDASQVYGSDTARAQELRALDGTGHLKVSTGNFLPFNVNGFPNQPSSSAAFFLGGDVRVNENSPLTALQTLFMREHNFWADFFSSGDPTLDDDGIYFRARAVVCAEIEKITYTDFLPGLIGAITTYAGYDENVDPSIANVFASASFRFGHSLLTSTISRLDSNNQSIGDLLLGKDFFKPNQITSVGIEPYLRGLARQEVEKVDRKST